MSVPTLDLVIICYAIFCSGKYERMVRNEFEKDNVHEKHEGLKITQNRMQESPKQGYKFALVSLQ